MDALRKVSQTIGFEKGFQKTMSWEKASKNIAAVKVLQMGLGAAKGPHDFFGTAR